MAPGGMADEDDDTVQSTMLGLQQMSNKGGRREGEYIASNQQPARGEEGGG